MPMKIRVESLVVDEACPYDCPACSEHVRDRRAQRETIVAAQAALFEDFARPMAVPLPSQPHRRAA